MRRLLPAPEGEVSGNLDDWYRFPVRADSRPWVRASFVSSLDGAVTDHEGRSGGLSNAIDRAVFGALRRTCNVVLVGAGTARTEGYRPSQHPIALVTARCDLPLDLPLLRDHGPDDAPVLVLTTDEAAAHAPDHVTAVAEVIACGPGEVSLERAVAALAARGLPDVHCEGGPALISSLLSAGLLDEVVLTIVPELVGGQPHLLHVDLGAPWRLHWTQLLDHDGTLLLRADVRR